MIRNACVCAAGVVLFQARSRFNWRKRGKLTGETECSALRTGRERKVWAFETLWALSCIAKDSNGGRRRMIWVATQIRCSVRSFSFSPFVFPPSSSTYAARSRCYTVERRNWPRLIAAFRTDYRELCNWRGTERRCTLESGRITDPTIESLNISLATYPSCLSFASFL